MVVVGTSGAGKSTLARELSMRLGIPHIELDALRHGPNWTETPNELFRERLAEAVSGKFWVVDGNYGFARDITWSRATHLVWLDYSLPLVAARVIRRTARRIFEREVLWNGNREDLRSAVSREGVIWWALSTHRRRRRQLTALFADPVYMHLERVRVRSPREGAAWWAQAAFPDAQVLRINNPPGR